MVRGGLRMVWDKRVQRRRVWSRYRDRMVGRQHELRQRSHFRGGSVRCALAASNAKTGRHCDHSRRAIRACRSCSHTRMTTVELEGFARSRHKTPSRAGHRIPGNGPQTSKTVASVQPTGWPCSREMPRTLHASGMGYAVSHERRNSMF